MKLTLIEAIPEIAKTIGVNPNLITMIQFEDGSGRSFNYSVSGGKQKYIKL